MNCLFILNESPYGSEKTYNALRLVMALQKEQNNDVIVNLSADGVYNAVKGQNTPQGFYNVERMFKGILAKKGKVKL